MVKTKLEMEQILAGALLLGFDRIYRDDIILLAEDFLRKNPNYEFDAEKSGYINRYIESKKGEITLKDDLNMESYIPENDSNLRKRLEQIAGACIRKYLETFDIEEFILRKMRRHIEVSEWDIDRIYCEKQQKEIKRLEEKGYLTSYWEEDCIYDDYKVTKLSNFGKLKLFKIDYAKEIEGFTEELKSLRYDISLLDDFLLKQDLELPVWNILNVENLQEFCNDYDRAITEPGAMGVYFERIESIKGSILDENGERVLQDMLSVWDDGHCIYICHPNHVFDGAKLITADVKNIKCINWNDIDIEKMFRINDYKAFICIDCTEASKYVYSCLGKQMVQESKKVSDENAAGYLTVVEKYKFDCQDYYLVRGIIKEDCNGYSVAFNPEYKKVIPQSILDKSHRISGLEVPNVYCLRRKK